jgi:cytochrome c
MSSAFRMAGFGLTLVPCLLVFALGACGTSGRFDLVDPAEPCRAARSGAPPFTGVDLTHGERSFDARCAQCHRFSGEKPSQPGPDLRGVVSRRIGSLESFRYSRAFRDRSDTWTLAALDRYLEDPEWFAPGTRMKDAGLADPDERRDVIAWLACAGESE